MLNFVDITKELAFQDKEGVPDVQFGMQYSTDEYPLDFQYESDEAISSFQAIRKDVIDSVNLSTSLISLENGNHQCDGLTAFSTALDCGIYYFLVNNKYKSEDFQVISIIESSVDTDSVISISGLKFIDSTKELPYWQKEGVPYSLFGIEYASPQLPLNFQYKSSEAVSSFKAIKITPDYGITSETDLNILLISSDDGVHTCTGLVNYDTELDNSMYYFIVNDKYYSNAFINSSLFEAPEVASYLELIQGGYLSLIQGGYLKIIG